MPIVEYLYVDEKRLSSYFEQVSSPIAFDKVPVWNVGISLTGPKAEGTQARFARPYTTHEKIIQLVQYLQKNHHVAIGRSKGFRGEPQDSEKPFRLETCRARRIYLPPKEEQTSNGLAMWISLADETLRNAGLWNLYLLEDYRHDDMEPSNWSSFSGLQFILSEAQEQIRDSIIGASLETPFEKKDRLIESFSVAPIETLSQLGAQIGPERTIRTLYHVRATFMDSHSVPQYLAATFGYPIFVAQSNGA